MSTRRAAVTREPLTRERICAAGRAQVEAVGLDRLSLREVARSLDVSAAALYAHVEGKRGLVAAIAEDAFEGLSARFAAIDVRDPLARIRSQSRAYVDYALESPHLYQVMMAFEPELPGARSVGASRGARLERATEVFGEAMSAVTEAIDQGLLVLDDPTLVALILWSSVHGLVGTLSMGFEITESARVSLVDAAIETTLRGLLRDPDRG